MTGAEAKALKDEEITIELKRLRDKAFTLRSQAVTEKVEDVTQFKKVRRDIARLLTERNSRRKAATA
ncbi:MAG: 50S ribosomal protein L29 [Phycisphaerales bacterium]